MSNKNPFEIRSEVLTLAKEYMDQQFQLNKEFAERAFNEAVKVGKATTDQWKAYAPSMYSVEELTKKAQEMYSFVAKKD
jgi:hypothetical protein